MTTPSNQAEGAGAIGTAIQRAMGPAMSGLTGSTTKLKGVDLFRTSAFEPFRTSANEQFYVTR